MIELIGQGGMGAVFRAEQVQLSRVVALKVLKHDPALVAADPNFARRFNLEASMCAKISHPNVVTVFDYGQVDFDERLFYIAMEFLSGATLHQKLKRAGGSIPIGEAFSIAIGIARGLREAHKQGVVHRDLKPGNVILVEDEDGGERPKIVDFGLVKQLSAEGGEDLTIQGSFLGSPKYMSPEQVAGVGADHRSDIYSLGVILYQCLCGRVPFDTGTQMQILVAHASQPVPPMKERNPNCDIPEPIEQFVRRMLEKNRDARFQSMDEFLREVRALPERTGAVIAPGAFVSGQTGTYPVHIAGATSSGPSASGPLLSSGASGSGIAPRAVAPEAPADAPAEAPARLPSRKPNALIIVLACIGGAAIVGAIALAQKRSLDRAAAARSNAPSLVANPARTPGDVAPRTRGDTRAVEPRVDNVVADSGVAPTGHVEARATVGARRPSNTTGTSAARTRPPSQAVTASTSTTPTAPTAPTTDAPGFLTLDTTPYSVVTEGGRSLGTTPLIRVALAPGVHSLTLRNPEQNLSTTYQVTIRSGETVTRRLGLE
ncbi:MAG: serine/threonine protein kinase [Myxococcales bacterium]|nr:serine/threonine protein kinase [Myxococcales bacterium]